MAMLALLIAVFYTFQHVLEEQKIQTGSGLVLSLLHVPPLGDGTFAVKIPGRLRAVDYLPWLAPFWFAGVLFFQLRGVGSWLAARRLRRRGVCAAGTCWQELLLRLRDRVRLSRPVTLLESCLAEVPVVIGYVRPVILMPVGLLAGLTSEQVESILLHELAHIRRHDYLVNLLQIVVEGLVFYHPAVWWISGVIRAERENCCDDMVVAMQGDAFAYAAALTALEQNRGAMRETVLAATGGSLVKRVRRLLIQPEGPRAALTPVFSAAVLTVAIAAAMTAWQTSAPPRPPAPAAPEWPRQIAAFQEVRAQTKRGSESAVPATTAYNLWLLQDVAYIIRDEERSAYKNLQSDPEREHFIEQFWLRRDPTPGTPENEMKEEHYRRIAYTNDHFAAAIPGWKTDRGRIYITYGPPDEKETHPSGGIAKQYPYEQWLYHFIDGVGTNVVIEFVDPNHTGEYRMTMDPAEKDALALVRAPGDTPETDAATPKAGSTVQAMGTGATLISIPLGAYGDHRVNVYARVATMTHRIVQVYQDPIQDPAPIYTKIIALPAGVYRLEVVVKDTATNKLTADNIVFEVK
jgi:GWxTD domain-containing protein